MKVEMIICDCCKEEIPKVKKKDRFGIEREYYRFGKLNYGEPFTDINCHNLGLDLCERCAGNISLEMYKTRMEMINGCLLKSHSNRKDWRNCYVINNKYRTVIWISL